MEPLTMFVILDKSLLKKGWSHGSMMAQACHAVSKAIWQFRHEQQVLDYMSDIENMHKVTLTLQSESKLLELSQSLDAMAIAHVKWVELPEGITTAIATRPVYRSSLGDVLKKCSLYK